MGISIDVHMYNKPALLDALQKWGATDLDKAVRILEQFGTFAGDTYVLLNNEYYDGGNPYYGLLNVLDKAFGRDDVHTKVFLTDLRTEGISWADEREIAEELGINMDDEDDEDSD